jgi:hypothetical protein
VWVVLLEKSQNGRTEAEEIVFRNRLAFMYLTVYLLISFAGYSGGQSTGNVI